MKFNFEKLLETMVETGGSDLHLEVGRPPVIRLHGRLRSLNLPIMNADDTRELIHSFAPKDALAELDEVGGSDFAIAFGDRARFRVSILRQKGMCGAVLRQIPSKLLTFDQIGLPESVRALLNRPRGLVLVTGPTGSGKTTTLATMIDWINANHDKHIITIEDPVEYYHQHKKSVVVQREVGKDVTSFSEALRRALRQDPDVILMGELRDNETISTAITAAETGHLVFGTLHTTGSARTVDRIIDSFSHEQQEQIRAQLAVSLVAVVSQVLMPRADGKGRVAAFEILISTSAVENHVRKNETFKIASVIQTSRKLGMIRLDDHLMELHESGTIDRDTLLEFCTSPGEMRGRLGMPAMGDA